jgi:hypothetical protein
MRICIIFLIAGFLTSSAFAACDGLPWKFGMSHDEVRAISECGPYKSFKNGDLETYDGIFNGNKENFQFFFQDGKLWRIGISLYGGKNADAGAKVWLGLYSTLFKLFGDVETPDNAVPTTEQAAAAFTAKALEIVQNAGKIQMAPLKQPSDAGVFSSFFGFKVGDVMFFHVTLYFSERR